MQTKYQDKFGYPVPRTAGKVRPSMAQWIQEFIRPVAVLRDGDEQRRRRLRCFAKRRHAGLCESVERQAAVHSRRRGQQAVPRLWQHRKQSESRSDFSLFPATTKPCE